MISAKIIADSIGTNGKRLTTFELEYPRFIHSEFLTHKMVSKNSASSRAIPVMSMLKAVWSNPATPVHWGKNQSGMQAKEELSGWRLNLTKSLWNGSGKVACIFAWLLNNLGVHKQIVNRIVEPWSHIKVVASSTDWDNFFHLRNHEDAQPEIHKLAELMWEPYSTNSPNILQHGQWHLPYVHVVYGNQLNPDVYLLGDERINLEEAKMVSASMCAQTSYRKSDDSVKKAKNIFERLVSSIPVHASPFEHQGTPVDDPLHISGNLRGWHQYRQDIPNNVCLNYRPSIRN